MNLDLIKDYKDTIDCLKNGKGLKMPEIVGMVGYSYSTHASVIKNKRCVDSVKNRVKIQNFIKKNVHDVAVYKSLDDIPAEVPKGNGKATQVDIDTMVRKANVYLETDCDFWTMFQKLLAKKPSNIEIIIKVK